MRLVYRLSSLMLVASGNLLFVQPKNAVLSQNLPTALPCSHTASSIQLVAYQLGPGSGNIILLLHDVDVITSNILLSFQFLMVNAIKASKYSRYSRNPESLDEIDQAYQTLSHSGPGHGGAGHHRTPAQYLGVRFYDDSPDCKGPGRHR